ncbi:10 TM acyl transferase domain found in Cas1p-domain-containing protein [Clohesyomyces aquaticus]|uniref:10 TM acyl transferase domain found in Cas1p-domain-containing protein n=1 Tax=Clohesyomyces aquaticus TaxID=1231657 RepID=A0A1Y1ZT05_9PLEO|nr:10 TM acyl transferase domain found in Cas1p-domain-containing protein [Clohesyomyces aquaticus]
MPRLGLPRPSSLAEAFHGISLVLALVVVIATFYKHHVHNATDPYQCKALLHHGQWLDSPDREPEHKPFLSWQPPGCMLHDYTTDEIARCNQGGKILFVGDTGTRQIFWAAARKLDPNWVFEQQAQPDTHADLVFCKRGACLKFLWDPWLNSTALHEELKTLRDGGDLEEASPSGSGLGLDTVNRKSVAMLVGAGLWHARHVKIGSLKYFQDAINNIIASAYSEADMAALKTFSLAGKEGIQDQLFFAPVLEPQYEKLSPSRATTIIPEKITEMNAYLEQLSLHSGLKVLWSYANMTKSYPKAYGESGLHVIDNVAGRMAEVLLNARCNAKAAYQDGYPFDRTCCTNYRPINWVQIIGIGSVLAALSVLAIKGSNNMNTAYARVCLDKSTARQRSTSVSTNTTASSTLALWKLLLAVCYCFLADRTRMFDKVRKQYTVPDFRYLIAIAVVCCLLTIRRRNATQGRRGTESFPGSIVRQTFLPRSQSEESKGWMQVYILIYGYTGASGELDFYEVLRVFLALYIFLSGYSHTMYFLQKKDYSLQRVAVVLLRLNTLATLLSFMMARPYASYYFAPLVSFWFLTVYATLKVANTRNDAFSFLVAKIVTSAVITTIFIHLPGVLEVISFVLRVVCRAEVDAEEWRYRLGTDKYVAYVGMFVAAFYIRMTAILNTPAPRQSKFTRMLADSLNTLRLLSILFSIIVIAAFWILTRRSHDKADYDWWMPYIAWLPVLGFVVLRNATSFLRNYHCAAFSWLGRISLELYLMSQHVWMAGDGHGLLRTGLFKGDGTIKNDRWRDLALLTPIFLWLAWRTSAATAVVTSWVMRPEDEGSRRPDGAKGMQHARAGSELRFPNYENALPSPNTQVDMKAEIAKKVRHGGMSKDVRRRLMVIGVVLWIGNWLYV